MIIMTLITIMYSLFSIKPHLIFECYVYSTVASYSSGKMTTDEVGNWTVVSTLHYTSS